MQRDDLNEFVTLYNSTHRHDRKPTWSESNSHARWRMYEYDELIARDKASLDIFWLRDESLSDSDNSNVKPPPLAVRITEALP